jgi:four helix bundle protein
MAGVASYRELQIWQKSMDLCEATYRLVLHLPKDELYGLVSQMRRASVSVPSNIAEGFAREHPGSFSQSLRIAQGSLKELETQLFICQRVGHVSETQIAPLLTQADEIGRMIRGFSRTLKSE